MPDIGELVVRIKADATQLQQELSKATQTAKTSASGMASAFDDVKGALGELGIALSIGALVGYGKSAIETASNLQNMADRIGFSASSLATLQPILAHSGSSIEELSHSVYMMNNAIQMAIEGNPKAIQAFDDLGLSATKLKAMKPEDAFNAIIDALYRLDDINKQTEVGRALFSRSYASLIPLVKQSQGALEDYIETQKKSVPSDEAIERVHEFGNAMEDSAIRAKNAMIELLAVLLKLHDAIPDFEQVGESLGNKVRDVFGMGPKPTSPNLFGADGKLLGSSSPADLSAIGGSVADKSGRGNNNDIKPPGPDPQQAIKEYIENLNEEAAALTVSKQRLQEYTAEKAAASAAGVKLKDLTPDEIAQIDAATDAYEKQKQVMEDLQKQQEKQIQMTAQLEAQISSSMADIILNFKNMGQTVTQVLDQIAKKLLEDQITTPLVNSLGQLLGAPGTSGKLAQSSGTGLFSSLFSFLPHFASGGTITGPSIVGEKGPELFIPPSGGTIVPNGQFGGSSIVLNQVIQMQPGLLPETVGVAIRNAAPQIAALAHASVIQAIRKGGPDAKVVGLRSQ